MNLSALGRTPQSRLTERFVGSGTIDPAFWWKGVVWATAATATHNVQQMSRLNGIAADWPGPLKIDDDPLAYLGVLVDIIQEWDRYSVRKLLDVEPIQGSAVELNSDQGVAVVCFLGSEGARRADKVKDELDKAL